MKLAGILQGLPLASCLALGILYSRHNAETADCFTFKFSAVSLASVNSILHIRLLSKQKVRQPELPHRKTPTPIVAKQSLHSIGSLYNQAGVAFLPKRVCLIV